MHVMLFAIVSIIVVGCAFCMHVRAKCRKVCCSDGEEEDEEEDKEKVGEAGGAGALSLQAYDFPKKRRNARATVTETM